MSLVPLESTLQRLRQSWLGDWLGLPAVWRDCVSQLGGVDMQTAPIDAVALTLAQELEQHGQQLGPDEPPYHNRLHFADALVCLTALLLKQRAMSPEAQAKGLSWAEGLMLLAMLGHDAWHPGRRNASAAELERRSAEAVTDRMAQAGLALSAQREVGALILATALDVEPTPTQASAPFEMSALDSRAMLVREADVLASALPRFGGQLTQALADEWARQDQAHHAPVPCEQVRAGFLRQVACFASPPAQALGLPALVARQLAA